MSTSRHPSVGTSLICFQCNWRYLQPCKNEGGGGVCATMLTNRCLTHTYMIYKVSGAWLSAEATGIEAPSLDLRQCWKHSLLVLLLLHFGEQRPLFTQVGGGGGRGLGWKGGVGRGDASLPSSRLNAARTPADSSVSHLWGADRCGDGRLLSTGAVPAALNTVEDLLLQFLPLLLLLRQALGRWLRRVLAVIEEFAVLSVPQVSVQAARVAEEGVVATSLGHFTLAREQKKTAGNQGARSIWSLNCNCAV